MCWAVCSQWSSVFSLSTRTMTEKKMRFASGSVHESVLVITILVEEIRDAEMSYALRDEILSLIDGAMVSHVVLDLQRVTFMGSVGFLAFLAVRRHVEVGQIVICNISSPVRHMFELCRLISNDPSTAAPFEAEDTLEAALARSMQNE